MSVIAVGGLYATGGSALRDFFRDQQHIAVFPNEFRVLKEHEGLISLRQSLRNSRSAENIDLATRAFEKICREYARSGRIRYLQKPGCSYDRFTNREFLAASQDFLDSLTSYLYPMDTFLYDLQKTHPRYFIDLFRKILLKHSIEQDARMIFFDQREFDFGAQRYLEKIFIGMRDFLGKPASAPLVLHNLLSNSSLEEAEIARALIPGLRVIVVDRDPRDIFLSLPMRRYLPESSVMEKALAFIEFHRNLRVDLGKMQSKPWVKKISFEDLVTQPRLSGRELATFLDIPELDSKLSLGPNFLPAVSATSIGLWKKIENPEFREALDLVATELGEVGDG